MIKLPISDYVANYYKEHNIQLTYRQQARLCWTEAKTYNERIGLLEQILKESDDEELNREIEERIAYEKKAFSIFATNDINQSLYALATVEDDDSEYEMRYFKSVYMAIEHARKYYRFECCIKKNRFFDFILNEDINENESDCFDNVIGRYYLTENQEIIDGWTKEYKPPFEYDDNNRFENLFLNIECPFGVGDIVMSEEWENPQVVAVDHDCFKQHYERLKNHPDIGSDATDNFIRTEYRDKDGNLDYEHTNPFQLWKIGNINEE